MDRILLLSRVGNKVQARCPQFVDDTLDPSSRRKLAVGRRPASRRLSHGSVRSTSGVGRSLLAGRARRAGWSLYQQHVFAEELSLAPAPLPLSYNIKMLGPVLIAVGSEQQQRRFLPRARRLDDWWCQGFSEPEAGSDLASLRTTARREGDAYVLNGHKAWTSLAHLADWMFCLAVTDPDAPRRQDGISFFLVDMQTPGSPCVRSAC